MSILDASFPEKTGFLFEPCRYKVMYGGRGSGKSHSAAKALLLQGLSEKHRVLCAREVQKSIKDSVHKLLSDQISEMNLGAHYQVLETVIRGTNGTEFLFSGLSSQTAESIKSFEGVTRCWLEEAQNISKKSWDILIPTIRKDNSEIWVTFNPVLETDDTYRRFVTSPPKDCKTLHLNYHDNPFFPMVLEQERIHCQATESEEDYNNIWLGHCRSAVSGAIYAQDVALAVAQNRLCFLPYDPAIKVHAVWDLGFADATAVTMVQRCRSELRVIDYLQTTQVTIDKCASMLRERPYNWGYMFLPHDGFSKERKVGTSDAEILQKFGFKIKRVPKTSEEDRIKNARAVFHRVAFDKQKTAELLECLKRFRRGDNIHGADTSPIHDQYSHGADSFGYMCQVVNEMVDDGDESFTPRFDQFKPFNSMGYILAGFFMGGALVQNLF